MQRPRLQFRLSTLLWITLAVATFFGIEGWRWFVRAPASPGPDFSATKYWNPPERPEGEETLSPPVRKTEPDRRPETRW
jgi:hypothetical protein